MRRDDIFDKIDALHRRLDERRDRAVRNPDHSLSSDAFWDEIWEIRFIRKRLSDVHLAACRRLYGPLYKEET